ncbi:MAG TPA: hypothetical protein VFM88_20305 [Vicinamibacteria bacterium]|nr:hypothetical protein [Vicinamibacteria bacterium]
MQLLALIVRVAFVLIVVRLLVRFAIGVMQGYRGLGDRGGARRPRPGDLVRDRVCNTFVPRERAVRADVAGREEHFCSTACRDKALLEARRAS